MRTTDQKRAQIFELAGKMTPEKKTSLNCFASWFAARLTLIYRCVGHYKKAAMKRA